MPTPSGALHGRLDVKYRPAWLTWVASTTSCLNGLGHDCDLADVAGLTGYAFVMAVHEELCPSGPTMFDWGMLDHGVNLLGRSTLVFGSSDCHTPERASELSRAHCEKAYELVVAEIAAGRPCVVWGAYVPEFAVAVGVEDGAYLVSSCKEAMGEPQPPVPHDELHAPGGPYVMAFPTRTNHDGTSEMADQYAVGHAAALLTSKSPFPIYGFGLRAYGTWIRALERGRLNDFGNAYNAQCWAESRNLGHRFLERVRDRRPAHAAALQPAVDAYANVTPALREVADLFPFPAGGESDDPSRRAAAVAALRVALAAETQAANALEAAAVSWAGSASA